MPVQWKCCFIEIYCKCMNTMQRIARRFQSWMLCVESRFLSIFRPPLDVIQMRVCVDCVNAYCNTQVFVYNFIFHVFRSRCVFFFSLSLPLFNFPPPRYVYVYSILCAYTLSGKNCNKNNKNTNPTVHTDIRIAKQILWYL